MEEAPQRLNEMKHPLRSQSFRHRPKPPIDISRYAKEEAATTERRRSTPTVTRRCSLRQSRLEQFIRTDVWPEAKQMSEVEERFLKLPDSEDYTRVRQFKIDSKGAVVARGDSFRRKRNQTDKNENSPSPFRAYDDSAYPESPGTSIASSEQSCKNTPDADNEGKPSTSHPVYKIYVLGQTGAGKSSLISQFITSEYKNAFADEIEHYENTVSICIGGQECDLIFLEADPTQTDDWETEPVQAYVLVYSIDRKSSFRACVNVLEELRRTKNHTPVIVAGNKIDLERKRTVAQVEVRAVGATYSVAHFEISVALNHDVDDLLVGIVAEVKEADKVAALKAEEETATKARTDSLADGEPEFKAAIRRFSQRKKRQMGSTSLMDLESKKCHNFNPAGLIDRFLKWRRES